MAIPTIHTWVNNEKPDFRLMNQYLEEPFNFLMNPPMVRLRKTTTQSIPNNVFTPLNWDFVEVETVNFWDSTNPSRITPSVPGYYVGTYGYSFTANVTGNRSTRVLKNGVTTYRVFSNNQDAYTNAAYTQVSRGNVFFEAFNGTTDYITAEVFQNSGGSLSVITDVIERQPDLVLRWFAAL